MLGSHLFGSSSCSHQLSSLPRNRLAPFFFSHDAKYIAIKINRPVTKPVPAAMPAGRLKIPMPTIPARVDFFFESRSRYDCWWQPEIRRESSTWDGDKTLVNNGKNYQPQLVTAGFLNHQQYHPPFKDLFGAVHGIKIVAFQKVAVDNRTEPLPLVVRQGWQRGNFGATVYTPWKIKMEPKNGGLEDDFPFQLGDF